MILKINLVSSIAALALFFLPWIDIQCSNRSFITQNGIQMIYGGGSISKEIEGLKENDPNSRTTRKDDESMGYSALVAVALLCVIGAIIAGFMAFRADDKSRVVPTGILCTVALGAIILQMMIGFPVQSKIAESLAEDNKKNLSEDPLTGAGKSMTAAIMMNIQIKHRPGLYLELLALGIPTLILANSGLDRLKRTNKTP